MSAVAAAVSAATDGGRSFSRRIRYAASAAQPRAEAQSSTPASLISEVISSLLAGPTPLRHSSALKPRAGNPPASLAHAFGLRKARPTLSSVEESLEPQALPSRVYLERTSQFTLCASFAFH